MDRSFVTTVASRSSYSVKRFWLKDHRQSVKGSVQLGIVCAVESAALSRGETMGRLASDFPDSLAARFMVW